MLNQTTDQAPRRRRKLRVGLMVALAAATVAPVAAFAQADEAQVGEPPTSDGGYVTTSTEPERSLDVTAFSPECIADAPYISYTIVPVGFTSSGPATLTFFDRNGNFVEQRTVSSLSGSVVYPGASVDGAGNATDWPGWTTAPDGSWIPDPSDAILREGLTIQVEVNPTATASVSYPPATSKCANPPDEEEKSLDVTAFAPVCISDAPFIEYNIVPVGFESTGPATLTMFDRNGNFVEEVTVSSLSGRVVYPGASVDANGNPTDWPGWKQADDGSWIPDASDAFLREGLTVQVEVNPTASASVTYPPATSTCANPPDGTPPTTTICTDGTTGGNSSTGGTTGGNECDPPCTETSTGGSTGGNECDPPCEAGNSTTSGSSSNESDPCTPCYPGQNNDDNPADDCTLPRTGGGPGNVVIIGAATLLAGLLLLGAARRRKLGNDPTVA